MIRIRKNVSFVVLLLLQLFLLAGCGEEGSLLDSLSAQEENTLSAEESADKGEEIAEEKEDLIFVHVCGAVRVPGVYELPAGSHFFEAISMAGGFLESADQEYLNLAQGLTDGSRLQVPTKAQTSIAKARDYQILPDGSISDFSGEKEQAEDGLVNINTADEATLCRLSGIGEGKAKAIIAYREEKGGFSSIEEIKNVSGIGDALFQKIAEQIKV